MSIHTFGSKAEEAGLKEIFSLSSNLTAAKSAAAAIDLMTIPYQNYRGDTQTDFDTAFGKMNKAIGLPGDGATASSPQKVLYYVSDGVNDASKTNCSKSLTYSSDGQTRKSFPRCQEPLDPTLCTTLKSRGIKIAVLYTTYFPLPTNSWYTKWIAPFQPQIATNMRSCASDGLYFEVSPSQGIAEAMNSLFLKTVNQISLTK